MNFLKKLFGDGSSQPRNPIYLFSVKCKKCGDVLEGRVDLYNDLSVEYEGHDEVYYVRKVLMSNGGLCFQRVEVDLKFSAKREMIDRQVVGGEFV